MKNAIVEAVKPDIEVVVRTNAGEVAVLGLFDAGNFTWDVVVGVTDDTARAGCESALQIALTAIQSASFVANGMVGGGEQANLPWEESVGQSEQSDG